VEPPGHGGARGQPIVIIDDEQGVLDVLSDLLEDEGFRVVCLDHPKQVASLEERIRPCLFLIDIMLPGESGIDVARQLRAHSFGSVPMIAMSASVSWVQAARATGLFQDTLAKPFELDALLAAVERNLPSAG
jgi:DNA-binding response OmpR family regulator